MPIDQSELQPGVTYRGPHPFLKGQYITRKVNQFFWALAQGSVGGSWAVNYSERVQEGDAGRDVSRAMPLASFANWAESTVFEGNPE